jgi:type VI secretion system secreted protein VgrG
MLLGEDRMAISQDKFAGALVTPLGQDVLCLTGFTVDEALGEPFEIQVECVSEQENIDFNKVLGQACSIKLKTYEQKERFFCGVLTNAQWLGSERGGDKDLSKYRLLLRPWFWLLNHSANCRIFLDKDVKEIIQKVFSDLGFSSGTDFKFRTTADYDKIKYCVQYRESDFAFVSRLMEQFGIYYYFEHKDKQHIMVLADSRASHDAIKDLSKVNFHGQVVAHNRTEQQIDSWVSDRRFCTGTFTLNDYDYLHPPKKLCASKQTSERYVRSLWEVYDYPGKYDEQEKGEKFAQFRLEAEQALDRRRNAGGDAPSLFAGGLVTLEKHPTKAENKEYLVVRARHNFGVQSYVAGGDGPGYHGSYQLLESDRPFRSLPLTPKSRIHGIQTAKVVAKEGEDNEEISIDEHGHIWVQFYWDREPQKSCPIRVSQPWAGRRWGHQFFPRVGMEVVVEFLEGDPDRPLVIGCVYNGVNTTPSKFPQDKNWSGVKSDSTKGHDGHNYFILDDTKGKETMYLVAEKDHVVTVNDSETHTIGHSRNTTIKNGRDELVLEKGDRFVGCKDGYHTTYAAGDLLVRSDATVTQLAVGLGVTSQTLSGLGMELKAPTVVTIDAPVVIIQGNLMVTGGITFGPMCKPVT